MKKIQSALISVFYKDGLETLVPALHAHGIQLFSTGGTQQFIEKLGLPVTPVETITGYPSILGGRVKTLHPLVFGGILGKRANADHRQDMQAYHIPEIDLVIVDLYPFEETVAETTDETLIIEKIDIGGPSMIRAAAKNFADVAVIAHKSQYAMLEQWVNEQQGSLSIEQRKTLAAQAFNVVAHYDVAIAHYFNPGQGAHFLASHAPAFGMRYGENPHQPATFYGNPSALFEQLNGKELSYNNLVDVDAAIQLMADFNEESEPLFAIIKHTNVCGVATRSTLAAAWQAALAGDPESAFGGVIICNAAVDTQTAAAINEIFFEVLIAPAFEAEALQILQSKKNRILLQLKDKPTAPAQMYKSLLNGALVQAADTGNYAEWRQEGGRSASHREHQDLVFANIICKHLKSNAIALVLNKQLVGKGCGQTSRIDALRHAIDKAAQFNNSLEGAVLASDAFFPFDDCVRIAHTAGITAFIQPGGSIRDKDSFAYCRNNNLAMVITGLRHFKH